MRRRGSTCARNDKMRSHTEPNFNFCACARAVRRRGSTRARCGSCAGSRRSAATRARRCSSPSHRTDASRSGPSARASRATVSEPLSWVTLNNLEAHPVSRVVDDILCAMSSSLCVQVRKVSSVEIFIDSKFLSKGGMGLGWGWGGGVTPGCPSKKQQNHHVFCPRGTSRRNCFWFHNALLPHSVE